MGSFVCLEDTSFPRIVDESYELPTVLSVIAHEPTTLFPLSPWLYFHYRQNLQRLISRLELKRDS